MDSASIKRSSRGHLHTLARTLSRVEASNEEIIASYGRWAESYDQV